MKAMLKRLFQYFTPHFFSIGIGLAVAFTVSWLASSGGSCRVLCYPPITATMGILGGFLGAQLYRSENPLRPLRD